MTLQRSAHHT